MQVQVTLTFDPGEVLDIPSKLQRILADGHAVQISPVVVKESVDQASPDAEALKLQRQEQAAKMRAAKAAKAKPAEPPVDVNGAGEDAEGEAADDMGLAPPSMSPGEAKDAALALVREVYSSGHVPEVKALQKELGVAKFYDVPVETGHKFYQRVMKLAQGVGIRQ